MTTQSNAYDETAAADLDLIQDDVLRDDEDDSSTSPAGSPTDPETDSGTEGLELEERQALRRVAGMSTELTDIS